MIDVVFDGMPWESVLNGLSAGDSISAMRLLSLLEEESDEMVEEVLLQLELRGITLDISDLPTSYGSGDTAVRLRREAQLVHAGNLLDELEENDPLRLYLQEVEMLPATADAQRMAERFAAGYDPVLPGLSNLMLPLVIEMAKEMTGRGVLLMDLIQEGNLGLWQGILNFRSGNFQEHAKWWIHQYLARAVLLQARAIGLGQHIRQSMEDYRMVDERLLMELGRNPTTEEIAQTLHIQPDEAENLAQMVAAARFLNQAKRQNTQPETEAVEETQHVEDTALFQSRQRIQEMLSVLTEREKLLITLRFGLEGGLPLNPAETGERLGMTASEVVAAEAAALKKMGSSATR